MKFPRYLLALCAIFFLAVVISAQDDDKAEAKVEDEDNVDIEARNPLLLRAAIKVIQLAVKWAVKHCVKEAAEHCKQHWKNPKELVKCGKAFLEANKGRCAAG